MESSRGGGRILETGSGRDGGGFWSDRNQRVVVNMIGRDLRCTRRWVLYVGSRLQKLGMPEERVYRREYTVESIPETFYVASQYGSLNLPYHIYIILYIILLALTVRQMDTTLYPSPLT